MPGKSAQVKSHRNQVYSKYGGHCAFCGDPLGPIWHLWKATQHGLLIVDKQSNKLPLLNKNDMPACISCNSTRIHHSRYGKELLGIEDFRRVLYHDFEFLSHNTYFQKALRYNLIQVVNNPIVFYFERIAK